MKRRYNDFLSLHEKLVDVGVDKDGLPPKKLLGNKVKSQKRGGIK